MRRRRQLEVQVQLLRATVASLDSRLQTAQEPVVRYLDVTCSGPAIAQTDPPLCVDHVRAA